MVQLHSHATASPQRSVFKMRTLPSMSSFPPNLPTSSGITNLRKKINDITQELEEFSTSDCSETTLASRLRKDKLKAMMALTRVQFFLAEMDVLVADNNSQGAVDELKDTIKDGTKAKIQTMKPGLKSAKDCEKVVSSRKCSGMFSKSKAGWLYTPLNKTLTETSSSDNKTPPQNGVSKLIAGGSDPTLNKASSVSNTLTKRGTKRKHSSKTKTSSESEGKKQKRSPTFNNPAKPNTSNTIPLDNRITLLNTNLSPIKKPGLLITHAVKTEPGTAPQTVLVDRVRNTTPIEVKKVTNTTLPIQKKVQAEHVHLRKPSPLKTHAIKTEPGTTPPILIDRVETTAIEEKEGTTTPEEKVHTELVTCVPRNSLQKRFEGEDTLLIETASAHSHSTVVNLSKALQQIMYKSSSKHEAVTDQVVNNQADRKETDVRNTSTEVLVNGLYEDIMAAAEREDVYCKKSKTVTKGNFCKGMLWKILDQC